MKLSSFKRDNPAFLTLKVASAINCEKSQNATQHCDCGHPGYINISIFILLFCFYFYTL